MNTSVHTYARCAPSTDLRGFSVHRNVQSVTCGVKWQWLGRSIYCRVQELAGFGGLKPVLATVVKRVVQAAAVGWLRLTMPRITMGSSSGASSGRSSFGRGTASAWPKRLRLLNHGHIKMLGAGRRTCRTCRTPRPAWATVRRVCNQNRSQVCVHGRRPFQGVRFVGELRRGCHDTKELDSFRAPIY